MKAMKARSILILAIAAFAFGFFGNARAQTSTGPQVLITWKAVDSMAPAAYQGKALPGVGSKIVASVEVISNGGFANLGSRTIYRSEERRVGKECRSRWSPYH